MKHGSLFSGIGGFDLAAEWMGWENVFHCEWNEFGQRILKYYWPDAKSYGDITKTDFTIHRGEIDIITGGFPCQPYSQAGKRKGKADDRHLWPEMLRAIREIQPAFVVGENVYGLFNWAGGLVFEEVQADLENAGYEVIPFILPACGVNAPHRRNRIWFIAHSECERRNGDEYEIIANQRNNAQYDIGQNDEGRVIANTNKQGLQGRKINGSIREIWTDRNQFPAGCIPSDWQDFPTVSPIRGGDDGLSSKLVKQCLEGLGNAVVPQVVFEIFKAIEQTNK